MESVHEERKRMLKEYWIPLVWKSLVGLLVLSPLFYFFPLTLLVGIPVVLFGTGIRLAVEMEKHKAMRKAGFD